MINVTGLEKILITNWTSFINPNKLMELVKKEVENGEFPFGEAVVKKKTEMSISAFRPLKNNFLVWVEFAVVKNPFTVVIGTCEFIYELPDELKLEGICAKSFHCQNLF